MGRIAHRLGFTHAALRVMAALLLFWLPTHGVGDNGRAYNENTKKAIRRKAVCLSGSKVKWLTMQLIGLFNMII